jgi:spore maturation protein CgeB
MLGRELNRFLPVEPWIARANREMVLAAAGHAPTLVVVVGQNPVRAGALAQLRAMTECKMAYIWPDTMVFFTTTMQACLPLYDVVATYSRSSVPWLKRLGAGHVEWVPLAADPEMHPQPTEVPKEFCADVGFIGQWRPEREIAIEHLLANAPELSLKIWGPDWGRRCKGKRQLLRAWQGRSLYQEEFAKAVRGCKVNLNIIDPTNYPAANMRFFEIPIAGGCQVSSSCLEMEDLFHDGETVVYYRNLDQLLARVRELVKFPELRTRIAQQSQLAVRSQHTYAFRAQQILEILGIESGLPAADSALVSRT